jgi:hypothetical protein
VLQKKKARKKTAENIEKGKRTTARSADSEEVGGKY